MKTTKADLIQRNRDIERRIEPLELALADLARDRVTWFGRGDYRLGISRPNGAAGGIVIVRAEIVTADYWETWSQRMLAHIAAVIGGQDSDYNRELQRIRDVIESAARFVRESQRTIAA